MRNYIIPILISLLIFSIIGFSIYLNYGNETVTRERIKEATIELTNSENGIKRKKYVFTDENVYSVEDRFFILHFNSMDTFNKLKNNEGNVCEIKTIGTRVGFFSMYKTITEVNCNFYNN